MKSLIDESAQELDVLGIYEYQAPSITLLVTNISTTTSNKYSQESILTTFRDGEPHSLFSRQSLGTSFLGLLSKGCDNREANGIVRYEHRHK